MPGDGLEDLELRPLDVEDEPVDGGIIKSQEESIEREALEGDSARALLRNNPAHRPQVGLLVHQSRGVGEVDVVRPGLDGQTSGGQASSPVQSDWFTLIPSSCLRFTISRMEAEATLRP